MADLLYACAGAFEVTLVSDFLTQNQRPVSILGGLLIVVLGICILGQKPQDRRQESDRPRLPICFASAFAIAVMNPAKLSFTPAVEISFIKPKNQRFIAVSIEGEQSSPSLSQAQELRKLDKEGNSDLFTMHLENNDTAAAIARHVGSAAWQLPIYHYDDYEGWEVFQYYDIPSRYEIPSNAENITAEKAGDVYYSEPNRIVLFYHDGEIAGEYTLVGHFDATEEFISAVGNNPVLEGWGNKLVHISAGE